MITTPLGLEQVTFFPIGEIAHEKMLANYFVNPGDTIK